MSKIKATVIKGKGERLPFTKAEGPTARQEDQNYTEVITPPYNIGDLMLIREYSTIIPQCVEAYRQNICGFGVSLKYRDDETKQKETPEMKAEWNLIDDLIQFWNFEKPFKDILGQAIEDREYCGNGYIEIIRDGKGLPASGLNTDPKYMFVTRLTDPVDVTYRRGGRELTIKKQFRRFVQDINGSKVWFKQFGDPRVMDLRTGKFDDSTPLEYQANEIIHLKIGNRAYGLPRWIPHMIHVYGARKAEELNYLYFYQGRHVPAAIIVSNGQLTEESISSLKDYASNIEGVDNAHKFLLLEVEGEVEGVSEELKKRSNVELKSLAEILQQDALFLDYDDKSRQKVQSAFRLPDIYVGRSRDFNRATAQVAMELTEQQVFIPERQSLEFTLNNVLFSEYEFKHVDAYFNSPDISNPEDKATLLGVYNEIGGVAPNDIRDDVGKVLGKDLENFTEETANLPASLRSQATPFMMQKSAEDGDKLVGILKDLRDVLEEVRDEKN